MSPLFKIFPKEEERIVKKYAKEADKVFTFEEELKTLTDEGLKERSALLRAKVMLAIDGKIGEREILHRNRYCLSNNQNQIHCWCHT